MIGYLDTSALVPLLITEPSSASCRRFFDDADTVVSSRLAYVETAAALAQARRLDRITTATHQAALRSLEDLWAQFDIVEADEALIGDAAELAHRHDLRGHDAVHCASARQLDDADLVAAAGDRQLLHAWSALGLATYDTTQR
ncbi:MAG TPA: type II toxin-antitoxin system VapC family toxin [Jatrophihabitans sp.]|uniref:type II toxin-antitoxin system VapC family toxin n=1 Tax=Jatrophihabitans sp. TaxID=1932789 RepID=UPI002F11C7CA